mgnify:CR=1 FL=1
MAEYLTASSSRRHRIIRDAKEPPPFIVNTYEYAKDAVVGYMISSKLDREELLSALSILKERKPTGPNDKQNLRLCIEALSTFTGNADALEHLMPVERVKGPQKAKKLHVNGVDISVQPDIMLKERGKADVQAIGGLKLVFGKSKPLTEDQGFNIATMLKLHLDEVKPEGAIVQNKLCMVLDVFSGRVYTPPKAIVNRLRDVHAACTEIVTMWPHVSTVGR